MTVAQLFRAAGVLTAGLRPSLQLRRPAEARAEGGKACAIEGRGAIGR